MSVNEQMIFLSFLRLWFQMAFPCKFMTRIVCFCHKFTFTELMGSKHGKTWRKTRNCTCFPFFSSLLVESVNPFFHCASFANTPKLSTRMRLPRLALFQRIKVNVFARWDQEVFPHVVLSRTSSWGFQKQVVVFLIFSFKWNSGSMKPPVDAYLRSLVYFAQ